MTSSIDRRRHPAQGVARHAWILEPKCRDYRLDIVGVGFESNVAFIARQPVPAEVHGHHAAAIPQVWKHEAPVPEHPAGAMQKDEVRAGPTVVHHRNLAVGRLHKQFVHLREYAICCRVAGPCRAEARPAELPPRTDA